MVTLKLDERELAAFSAVCDMALKGGGLAAHDAVTVVVQALAAAVKASREQHNVIALPEKEAV